MLGAAALDMMQVEDVFLRNLEAGNYPVAFLQLRDLRANFVDDPHPFVSQYVTFLHLHDLFVVEMEIRAANCSPSDFADDIAGICDSWNWYFFDLDVSFTMPDQCFHGLAGTLLLGVDIVH